MTYGKNRNRDKSRHIFPVKREKQESKTGRNRQAQYNRPVCFADIIKYPACKIQQTAYDNGNDLIIKFQSSPLFVYKYTQKSNHQYLTYRGYRIKYGSGGIRSQYVVGGRIGKPNKSRRHNDKEKNQAPNIETHFKAQLKQAAEIAKQFRGSAGDLTPAEPRDGTRRLRGGGHLCSGYIFSKFITCVL